MTPAEQEERREKPPKRDGDPRQYYDRDYARIIHSASFRRLQGKTQIYNIGESDFYRTRLTHSIEVSQIGQGIVQYLDKYIEGKAHNDCPQDMPKQILPPEKLVAAIGLTHDLGHPPFGHGGGEIALNYCMRNDGGFEGNGQTLRILTKLESFTKNAGANLARRTLLGCLKYPVSYERANRHKPELCSPSAESFPFLIDRNQQPPKCYFDSEGDSVQWILEPLTEKDKKEFQALGDNQKAKYCSFDCSIMNLADDISYGVHDLEDAIKLELIRKEDLEEGFEKRRGEGLIKDSKEKECFEKKVNDLFGENRKDCIGRVVNNLLRGIYIKETGFPFEEPLLKYEASLREADSRFLDCLKKIVREKVIHSPNVQHFEFKGQRMIIEVFEILNSDPGKFLPVDFRKRLGCGEPQKRVICDYIAGMTDGYLLKTYERLSSPRMGSVFERI
ncbi:MAG: anti-phage deoxyguanosine triphosphatase [Parvularculales bacterium]